MVNVALVVKGAAAFGVRLDDTLVFDSRHEPPQGILERIAERREAIVALLQARRAAASIDWEKLADISVDELCGACRQRQRRSQSASGLNRQTGTLGRGDPSPNERESLHLGRRDRRAFGGKV